MLTHLSTQPPDNDEIAKLFQAVADGMQQSVSTLQPDSDLRFELVLKGQAGATQAPVRHAPGEGLESSVSASARRLDSALARLHGHSGVFICRTQGEIGGALLELALMADHHVMDGGAVLVPSGLFDSYVPRAFGWSRMIERAGAGRVSSLLLSRGRVEADDALKFGLCDAVERTQPDGQSGPYRGVETAPLSVTASRLAQELSERTTRTGGITPRQARVLERAAFALAFSTDDPREGIASFFAGRPARFGSVDTGQQDPSTP